MTHQYMGEIDTSGTESARLDTNSVIRIIYHWCTVANQKSVQWLMYIKEDG